MIRSTFARRARNAYDRSRDLAIYRNIVGNPDSEKVRRAIANGTPIPDDCLPGRLLNKLTSEELADIKHLRPQDINDRII